MACTFSINGARQTDIIIQQGAPDSGHTTIVVKYALCIVEGTVPNPTAVMDVMYNRGDQSISLVVANGAASPTPTQVAVGIKGDTQTKFGGAVDNVLINGSWY